MFFKGFDEHFVVALPKESKQRKGTAFGGVAKHRNIKAKTAPRLRRFLTPFYSYAAESRALRLALRLAINLSLRSHSHSHSD